MTETETRIYQVIKDNLGEHLTLNPSVSPEVGCGECLSRLLQLGGIGVPKVGIASTGAFLAWLHANPDFQEIDTPEQGCVIISATGSGNNSFPGHCGIICAFNLMYTNDWGIASNDSNTGTLREQWNYKDWISYYEVAGGMKVYLFRPL